MSTDEQNMKAQLIETFNTVADGYDDHALRFFPASANNLASILALRGDEQVLDVACGTGHASLAIARMLPGGRVTAVDFSSGMLAQARRKAEALKITNIDLIERDMQELEFEDRFDVAVCAFGIFFVPDMERQLAHIASTVKPGGRIAITNFVENYFSPCKELFFDRMAGYGVPNPPMGWKRIATEAGCSALFGSARLADVRVETRNVGYYLDNAEAWWSIVWNAGLRRFVTQLPDKDRQQFKREHLREIDALRTREGIRLDIGVLYTMGTRPEAE
jgi:ubiquinone/menaquinone biosynthesis C-methylase UbiE